MAILREKQIWHAYAASLSSTSRFWQLSTEEQANVKEAIRKLRVRFGRKRTAQLLGVSMKSLKHSTETKRKVSAGMALLVARAAWAPVDDILGGRWPGPPTCPVCGRP